MFSRNQNLRKRAAASFLPDFIASSVLAIDFEYLKSVGITTCLIDLDGTVVDRGKFEVDGRIVAKLKRAGLDIKIATNRSANRSLQALKEDLSATGVIHPRGIFGKPSKRYLQTALKEFGLKPSQAVMIGDRFIQDIFGANRSGVYSLLVYKVGRSTNIFDRLLSRLERLITKRLERKYNETLG